MEIIEHLLFKIPEQNFFIKYFSSLLVTDGFARLKLELYWQNIKYSLYNLSILVTESINLLRSINCGTYSINSIRLSRKYEIAKLNAKILEESYSKHDNGILKAKVEALKATSEKDFLSEFQEMEKQEHLANNRKRTSKKISSMEDKEDFERLEKDDEIYNDVIDL